MEQQLQIHYEIGNTFSQQGTNATGNLVGTAGSATGNLDITNAGLGYTPASGSFTFTGVNLVTLTGNGRGATADITVSNGSIVASGATILMVVLDIKLVMLLELIRLVLQLLVEMQDLQSQVLVILMNLF